MCFHVDVGCRPVQFFSCLTWCESKAPSILIEASAATRPFDADRSGTAGKKATQNGGEPFTTAAAPSAAATASGPTIQPRPQSNHDVLAWGSEGRLSHPHATGLQTSEQDQVPPSTTANSSHTLQGDATITGLLRQLQDPLTSSSLRPQ